MQYLSCGAPVFCGVGPAHPLRPWHIRGGWRRHLYPVSHRLHLRRRRQQHACSLPRRHLCEQRLINRVHRVSRRQCLPQYRRKRHHHLPLWPVFSARHLHQLHSVSRRVHLHQHRGRGAHYHQVPGGDLLHRRVHHLHRMCRWELLPLYRQGSDHCMLRRHVCPGQSDALQGVPSRPLLSNHRRTTSAMPLRTALRQRGHCVC